MPPPVAVAVVTVCAALGLSGATVAETVSPVARTGSAGRGAALGAAGGGAGGGGGEGATGAPAPRGAGAWATTWCERGVVARRRIAGRCRATWRGATSATEA